MATGRVVRCGLIQAKNVLGPEHGLEKVKKAMIDRHLKLIAEAASKKRPMTGSSGSWQETSACTCTSIARTLDSSIMRHCDFPSRPAPGRAPVP